MKRKVTATNLPVKRTRIEMKQARRDAKKNPAILKVQCNDNLSLFRAIRIGMFYCEKGGGKWEPAEHYAWSDRLTRDAETLWSLVGVPLQHASYDLDDAKKVFEYLEKKDPGTYRILIFSEGSNTQTVYNSGNNAKYNICLYYRDGHFDLMMTPQKFFRKRHYCVDCEKTYEDIKSHSKCKIRCRQCFRIGYGYPCDGDWSKKLECADCRKYFPNQDCMEAHKPYSCNTFHRCAYCNVYYRVLKERASKGHRCDKQFSPTPNIATKQSTVPSALKQDGLSCARTASTLHHGGVQQSILSYITREVIVF